MNHLLGFATVLKQWDGLLECWLIHSYNGNRPDRHKIAKHCVLADFPPLEDTSRVQVDPPVYAGRSLTESFPPDTCYMRETSAYTRCESSLSIPSLPSIVRSFGGHFSRLALIEVSP